MSTLFADYILLPKRREKGSATHTMPPKVFPKVTLHLLKAPPKKIETNQFGIPFDSWIFREKIRLTKHTQVTGSRLSQRKADQETLAPAKIPAGMMNMLATECSRPRVTKAEMGNQMATAFPMVS